ncbi:hypothetical protein KKF84_05130 [Myxococcota bacterium]|nr:hypothetical protein [Myxococcota bacterium]MBU1534680.1 hypothetical protein [Myxococcota bacterium]
MTAILILITAVTMTLDPPKPQPFSPGTDLTINLGWQDGRDITPDGGYFSIGMLTQRTGNRRWAYELAFVSRDDHCHYVDNDRRCANEWGVHVFAGVNYDLPLSNDRKLFVSLRGGFFAALGSIDRYYYDNYYDDWDDDNLFIAAGVMGKAGIYIEFTPIRLGFEVMAGFGPSIGTESGIDFYLPVSGQFTFHYIFQ